MGWRTAENLAPEQFVLHYATQAKTGDWSRTQTAEADFDPTETPTGMYWTDAFFTHDATRTAGCASR